MSSNRSAVLTRREVLKQTGVLSALGVAAAVTPLPAEAAPVGEVLGSGSLAPSGFPKLTGLEPKNLYTEIGVRPIVNGRGTYTIISGSLSLPEVKRAMYEASFYFVQLDELMAAVGKEIAQLMGAPGATVVTGCEAAIALGTIACMAGTNVEKSQALPYRRYKNQVIIPKHSRNPYDFGVRMTGAEVVEVDTPEELQERLTAQVAMVYVLSSPESAKGPMSIEAICTMAKAKSIPVFVDAAAEEPLSPNIHIKAGASLVAYSGGKCMRGPQAAGVLLGDEDLTHAAFWQAAPHHNYGRAYKVGKEEIMGMLAAVRQWYKRDHEAEQAEWLGWLKSIEGRVKGLPSVTTEYLQPEDLSNKSPQLRIKWDANQLKITGTEMQHRLDAGTPRILLNGEGARPDQMASSVTIMPYMMQAADAKILADAIYDGLTKPGSYSDPVIPQGTAAEIGGIWLNTVMYTRGIGEQHFELAQSGNELKGMLRGEIYTSELQGTIHGNEVKLASRMQVSGYTVSWHFTGTVSGATMSGHVSLGEYGAAEWKAIKA